MVFKMTLVFWLCFAINAMASADSLRAMSQDREVEVTGHPQEQKIARPSASKISGTIHLNGQTIPDSFFVGIAPLLSAKWSPFIRRPKNSQTIYDRDFAFDLEPGLYTLVVSAFGYETLETAILVPDADTQVEVKAYLEPFGLNKKDDIEWVKLWGEFCRWRVRSPDIVELVKRDSVWVLPGENPVKEGEGYRFIVNNNNSEVYDLRHSNAKKRSSSLIGFSSIYKGGELIFDPSLYASPKRDSRTEFAAEDELQATFSILVKEMKDIRKKGMNSYGKMLRSADVWNSIFVDQGNRLGEIVNQYPPYFEQFLLQEAFEFLQRFHPHNRVMRELRKLRSEKNEYETKIKEHYQSAVYESYFSQMAQLAKKVDPNSLFFRTYGTFSSTLLSLDEGLHFAPHLGEKYTIPPFYFTGILVAHERNLPPGTKEGESLLWRMAQHYRDRDHPVAARSAIDQLIQRYPNSKTVLHGATDRLLNALDMREDSVAPDFVVQTVAGDSLRLSDFRGKFVMLDFWGTWCGPCLNELPHLKKLSQSFSDELKVIGLAHDDPRSLADFVKEKDIPYPNGIADPKIQKAYGIVSWPTTFLIAPNGKIIAKNLRGEKLVDLVAEKLAAHK